MAKPYNNPAETDRVIEVPVNIECPFSTGVRCKPIRGAKCAFTRSLGSFTLELPTLHPEQTGATVIQSSTLGPFHFIAGTNAGFSRQKHVNPIKPCAQPDPHAP